MSLKVLNSLNIFYSILKPLPSGDNEFRRNCVDSLHAEFCPIPFSRRQEHVGTLHRGPVQRPRQNSRHFPDDIFKWMFLNENVWISIDISLKFVPRGPINNILTLVQVMAWHRLGNKPLSEPMMVRLPTHICVTRPQWVNVAAQIAQCPPTSVTSVLGFHKHGH